MQKLGARREEGDGRETVGVRMGGREANKYSHFSPPNCTLSFINILYGLLNQQLEF